MAELKTQTLEERTVFVRARIDKLKSEHPEYNERRLSIEAIKQLLEEKIILY